MDDGRLERDLAAAVDGEVRFDAGTRAAYSTDASNFRQVPIGVVLPRTVDAAVAAVAVCREHGAPLLSRGGGTSLAGQCTNTAVVIDWTKYCHRVPDIDADARTCTVEPGIVLDVLNNEHLKPYGLRFGPEPATHMNCTLGGMIGNNSCGATAQRTGKVVDNIAALEVLLYDGTRFWCGPASDEEYTAIERRGDRQASIYRQLRQLRDRYGDQVRAAYPDIPRRVSGYNLDSLLPEHGFDVAGLLVGSESTLVTVLRAKTQAGRRAAGKVARRPRLPQRRPGRGRGPAHPGVRAPADRPGGPGPPPHHRPAAPSLERPGPARTPRGRRLPHGPVRRPYPRRGGPVRRGDARRPARHRARARRLLLRRPRPRGRAVGGPRRRPGRDRARAGPPRHLGRLGRLRRPPGPARGLPAGPEQAVRRVRLQRRERPEPVRPLRPGLRAHPHPLRPLQHRRRPEVPPVHGARRRPGRQLRGLPVRRARRRPVPRRTAQPHVRRGASRSVRRAEAHLRPRRQDEPRQGRPPGRAG